MNPLVATFIRQLEAEGHSLRLPDDLDDLIELHTLADKATETKPTREYLAQLRPVLHIGGLKLQRLSIGAAHFHDSRLLQWYPNPGREYWLSLLYLMAVGRNPGAVWNENADNRSAWWKAVQQWSKQICVPWGELSDAVREFLAVEERIDQARSDEARDSDLSGLLEELTAAHGKTPRHWTWHEDQETAVLLIRGLRKRQTMEAGRVEGSREDWLYQQKRAALTDKVRARSAAAGKDVAGAAHLGLQSPGEKPGVRSGQDVKHDAGDRRPGPQRAGENEQKQGGTHASLQELPEPGNDKGSGADTPGEHRAGNGVVVVHGPHDDSCSKEVKA